MECPQHQERADDDDDRPGETLEKPNALEPEHDLDPDEGADDEDLGVGEVDELEDSVHHRVAQRDQGVHESEDDTVEQNLREDADQKFDVHALCARRPERARAGAAMVSCLTILLSPHFPGSSLATCSTK